MKSRRLVTAGIVAALILPTTVWAWSPRTEATIVVAAMRLLSRDMGAPLGNVSDEIRSGASVSNEELLELIPNADIDPIRAIESQMTLLQAVHDRSVTPYFAYRLGVLGKLTAQVSAPMVQAPSTWRTRYYTEMEGRIQGLTMQPAPRRDVDPNSYFASVMAEANAENEIIVNDFKAGIGFDGVAGASAAKDLSRSVNAVADVWYTILRGGPIAGASQRQIEDYIVRGILFYVERGREQEVAQAYDRLLALGGEGADFHKRLGDAFFEGGFFGRAVDEYVRVLNLEPDRRDVANRIGQYYMAAGDEALENGALEEAASNFRQALEYDKLNTAAQAKFNEVQQMIRERDARREATAEAINEAELLREESDLLESNGDIAEAITRLQEASMLYATVTDEFPQLATEARVGASSVAARIGQLQSELVENATTLSGTGSEINAVLDARAAAEDNSTDLLTTIQSRQVQEHIDAMRSRLADEYITP